MRNVRVWIRNAGWLVCGGWALAGAAHALPEGRVIVKWRADAPQAAKQVLTAGRSGATVRYAGLAVNVAAQIGPGMQVVRASGIDSAALAERLRSQPEVAYAQPDRRKTIRSLPNDPLLADQWYLAGTETAAIRATTTWPLLTGSSAPVVAVLDTGVRPGHPDLAGRLLPGYDFVSSAAQAADGNGWDNDPSDAGDGLSSADLRTAELSGCGAGYYGDQPVASSWHGTKVTGILAASANNGIGGAGVAWEARILPVRTMGKCGGFDSDIIAAMRWAAGFTVAGAPVNPYPARVLNMSLGGANACGEAFQEVIGELTGKGVLVVAAAGNSTGPVDEPANCQGALAVGGVRHAGNKVGYSSFGPEVGISAPAGNCVNPVGDCLYPIFTTANSGEYLPGRDTYTDRVDYTVGTSFATPMAAGVAALMWSVNDHLTPALVVRRLQEGASPFPTDRSLPTCPAVVNDDSDQSGQCNCTPGTCGAGLLNAESAVRRAWRPLAVARYTGATTAGSRISLDASGSQAANGRRIAAVSWSAIYADGGAQIVEQGNQLAAAVVPQRTGALSVVVQVTDDAGEQDSQTLVLAVTGSSQAGSGTGAGSGNGSATGSTPAGGNGNPAPASGDGGGGGGGGLEYTALLAGLCWLLVQRRLQARA